MKGQVACLAAVLSLGCIQALDSPANPEQLKCIPGITRFSKRDSSKHFYDCSNSIKPVLTECEDGLVYNMRRQKCVTKEEQKKVLPIDDKALGRNFQLGSLYDARRNMFFPESSLWSQDTINSNSFQYDRRNVNLDVSANKRTLDKTDHMDISAHLTLDFMGGMVHVAGSAGYLKDDVTSEDEVNIEMTYRTSKFVKTLPKQTEKDYPEECSKPQFTHAVTSVTYGLDAVFVFKKLLESHETEEQITGQLEISINKIPGAAIEGEGSVDITDSDLMIMNHTSLTMYGDFSPETTAPTTFEDAVEFYKNLPLLASEGGQIIEVHLSPLQDVCTDADFILNDLSDEMMANVIKMLDELEQLDTKVTGLMNSKQSQKFKPLRENLNLYRKTLRSYVLDVKMRLTTILPNIRGGDGNGEDDLNTMLTDYTASQFYFDTSSEFLIDRNREIQAIRFLEENFPTESNIAIADYESANDVEYIFTRDLVVILDFHLLSLKNLTQSFLDGNRINESEFWYNRVDINGHVGGLLRSLKDFGLENIDQDEKGYLVKVSPLKMNDTTIPYKMSALIKGYVLSDQYEVPRSPITPTPYDITHENFAFTIRKYNEFTPGVRVYMTNNQNGERYIEDKMFPEGTAAGSDVRIVMEGLTPANIYRFSIKYLTDVGTSPPSVETTSFPISPTSKPQSLTVEEVTSEYMKVTWQPPSVLARGLTLADLQYKLAITGGDGYEKVIITPNSEFVMMEPLDATKYTYDVSVALDRVLGEALPSPNSTYTNSTNLNLDMKGFQMDDTVSTFAFSKPLPPKLVQVVDEEVSLTSAVIRWENPPKFAIGATFTHFVLKYSAWNENGTEKFSGTEGELILTDTEVELLDLSPGSTYVFTVKVVTSEGESDHSIGLMFTTKFDATDIAAVRTEIFSAIKEVEDIIKVETSFCAHREETIDAGTVVYDATLFLNNNNVEEADMNVYTGMFTAGRTGRYKVAVGLEMLSDSGQDHYLWVVKNGNKLEETKMHSGYSTYANGKGTDNGSRELILNINAGETISLQHETNGHSGIMSVTFCVSSIEFE